MQHFEKKNYNEILHVVGYINIMERGKKKTDIFFFNLVILTVVKLKNVQ